MSANQENDKKLSIRDKIFIGGLGALTPVIMNLLAVDLEKLLISLTLISIIAYFIKVVILFYIGGVVAYLNRDENKPIKLFQLGIYAPAMILAFANTNPLEPTSIVTPPAVIAPVPAPAIEEQVDKPDVQPPKSGPNADVAVPTSASASILLASSFIENRDSVPPKAVRKILKGIAVDSSLVEPLFNKIAKRDAKLIDSLLETVAEKEKEIKHIKLSDSVFHEFQYPDETVTEQILRGFFGWKSERLWYVVVGKFDKGEDAKMYAKLLTKEMRSHRQREVADVAGQNIIPRIFKPYKDLISEYSVVLGTNLSYNDAQTALQKIKRQKHLSIRKDQIELWKLPYWSSDFDVGVSWFDCSIENPPTTQ